MAAILGRDNGSDRDGASQAQGGTGAVGVCRTVPLTPALGPTPAQKTPRISSPRAPTKWRRSEALGSAATQRGRQGGRRRQQGRVVVSFLFLNGHVGQGTSLCGTSVEDPAPASPAERCDSAPEDRSWEGRGAVARGSEACASQWGGKEA